MTTPDERTRALLQTHEFLKELRDPEATPGVPDGIRQQAHVLLRHFPEPWQLKMESLTEVAWLRNLGQEDQLP